MAAAATGLVANKNIGFVYVNKQRTGEPDDALGSSVQDEEEEEEDEEGESVGPRGPDGRQQVARLSGAKKMPDNGGGVQRRPNYVETSLDDLSFDGSSEGYCRRLFCFVCSSFFFLQKHSIELASIFSLSLSLSLRSSIIIINSQSSNSHQPNQQADQTQTKWRRRSSSSAA